MVRFICCICVPYFVREMGRKSKAQKIIETQKDIVAENPEASYLVLYDFEGGNNPRPFYLNLHRLFDHYGGCFVQRSVVEVKGCKAGKAVQSLAQSYGADVLRYRVIEEE